MLTSQIVLIRGDRITDVGPSVQIPPAARVIDLSGATVLPGMIDMHVHLVGQGSLPTSTLMALEAAHRGLNAGFTTLADMNSRVSYLTVDLRNAINHGLVKGPRLQVSGPAINPRAGNAVQAPSQIDADAFANDLMVNSADDARRAVREAEGIRHGLREDLRHAGFRRRRVPRLHAEREDGQQPVAHARGDRGGGQRSPPPGLRSRAMRTAERAWRAASRPASTFRCTVLKSPTPRSR